MRVRTVIDFVIDETKIPPGIARPDEAEIRGNITQLVKSMSDTVVTCVLVTCDVVEAALPAPPAPAVPPAAPPLHVPVLPEGEV